MASFRFLAVLTVALLAFLAMMSPVNAAPIRRDELELLDKRHYKGFRGRPFRNRLHRHRTKPTRVLVQNKPVAGAQQATTTTAAPKPTTTKAPETKPKPTTTTTKTTTTVKPTPTKKETKPAPTSGGGSSGGSGKYSGDGTWYNTGLGSCGIVSSESELIVALNAPQMANGANPNHNPKCGEKIRVSGPKGSVVVTIVDTCPGCKSGDLDLSPAAFQKIADLDDGRVTVHWDYI